MQPLLSIFSDTTRFDQADDPQCFFMQQLKIQDENVTLQDLTNE
jgi:hypothetical protein